MGKWQIVRILLLTCAILIAYWIFCALAYGQTPIPPDIPSATDFHCSVNPIPEGWGASATVTYVNPTKHHGGAPWQIVLAEYKNKNRKKARAQAIKACTEWLDAVDKVRLVSAQAAQERK